MEKTLCVFSPTGRIYQLEYAFTAVKGPPHLTAVGVSGRDSVVVVCQKKVPDKLIRAESVTHAYNITDNIGAIIIGRPGDIKPRLFEVRNLAHKYWEKFGHDIPVSYLARRIADRCQVITQLGWVRLLGVAVLLFGMEADEDGTLRPKLFKVDPGGVALGHFGVAMGQKETEATNHLEKAHRSASLDANDESSSILAALGSLQHAVGGSLKATDVEACVVSASRVPVRKMTTDEIDEALTRMVERRAG
eukprot:TRINITY_DN67667_c0_g1_i1.p1 TRINITY_DN67667_c0_g1~~TRINITY_DN67667_c0_g1_i1.p1  ORF type:complete len:248 (+),score=49.54 TRINITY_DN67667_c0_g1_i1:212-955(+)